MKAGALANHRLAVSFNRGWATFVPPAVFETALKAAREHQHEVRAAALWCPCLYPSCAEGFECLPCYFRREETSST